MKQESRIALRNAGYIDPMRIEDYQARGGYEAFKKVLTSSPQEVVDVIKESGLRGRGGAGFPTGQKWQFSLDNDSKDTCVICNADEGEPGTYKDRIIMEADPHTCLEGLMISAYAVTAHRAYIYLRGEYFLSIERLERAIEQAKANGLLGERILGSDFSLDVHLVLGGGSYLCGDETALIESLEGKRGNPRFKPPFPAQYGFLGNPTVVNNVESLAHVPAIIQNGAAWYRGFGTEKSSGTKLFPISGDVVVPGCYEVEMGTPLLELIHNYAGGISENKQAKAVLIGGAAGSFLPPELFDTPLDFDSLKEVGGVLGSGAIIVLHEDRSIFMMLASILRFFQHESCGKCIPCRTGTRQLTVLLDRLASQPYSKRPELVNTMVDLSQQMAKTSLCPLGQSPILAMKSAAEHFEMDIIR